MPFLDVDEEIVKAADGMTIPEIFGKFGESHFRLAEGRVIARVLKNGSQVLATGGGAVISEDTRTVIRSLSVSIWLKAELPILLERIIRKGVTTRPMLKTGDPKVTLERLMDERHRFYAEADLTVCSRAVPQQEMVKEVLAELSRFLYSSKYHC